MISSVELGSMILSGQMSPFGSIILLCMISDSDLISLLDPLSLLGRMSPPVLKSLSGPIGLSGPRSKSGPMILFDPRSLAD